VAGLRTGVTLTDFGVQRAGLLKEGLDDGRPGSRRDHRRGSLYKLCDETSRAIELSALCTPAEEAFEF